MNTREIVTVTMMAGRSVRFLRKRFDCFKSPVGMRVEAQAASAQDASFSGRYAARRAVNRDCLPGSQVAFLHDVVLQQPATGNCLTSRRRHGVPAEPKRPSDDNCPSRQTRKGPDSEGQFARPLSPSLTQLYSQWRVRLTKEYERSDLIALSTQ